MRRPSPVLYQSCHKTAAQRSAEGFCAGRQAAGGCLQAQQSDWLDLAQLRQSIPACSDTTQFQMSTPGNFKMTDSSQKSSFWLYIYTDATGRTQTSRPVENLSL